jgi:BirA family biotin operon repressor/biotin-[acetyl-CoA-carboxylase] ligase
LANLLRRDYGVMAHLKWPNDVLVGSGELTRKIAGILTESCQGSAARAWAVGIGVNLNQELFATPLDNIATSLRIRTGLHVPIALFFGQLMREIQSLCDGRADLPTMWTELSRMPGQTVRLYRTGRNEAVRADGVDENGHLLVTHSDGRRERLSGTTGVQIHQHDPASTSRPRDLV